MDRARTSWRASVMRCGRRVLDDLPSDVQPHAPGDQRSHNPALPPLRIALLSYRSKPHCGGQGVYVRQLSRELAAQGHRVEVFSGPPYPDLDPGPRLTGVPSVALYREPDPSRTPRWSEYRDATDVLESLMMRAGAFPEPLTFSLRIRRGVGARAGGFGGVHDTQGLGYGLLGIARPASGGLGLPLAASIHHPISVDKRIDLA